MISLATDGRLTLWDKFAVQMNGMKEVLPTDQPTDGHTLLQSCGSQSKARSDKWHKSLAVIVSAAEKKKSYRPTDLPTDGHTSL